MKVFGKRYQNALLVIAVLAVTLPVGIFGSPVFAGMRAPVPLLELADYITYMKSEAKKNTLSENERDLLYFTEFAVETVELKRIRFSGWDLPMEKAAKHLKLAAVVKAFENKIYASNIWPVKLDEASLQKITKNRDRLKRILQSSEYSWAWILKQLGEAKESQSLLNALFKKEYRRVMALRTATYGMGQTPLGESETILGALNSLSTEKKQGVFNEQMRKMKTHISKLPESHIMT